MNLDPGGNIDMDSYNPDEYEKYDISELTKKDEKMEGIRRYYIQTNNKETARMMFLRRYPGFKILDIKVNILATKSTVGSYTIIYKPIEPSAREWKEFEHITNQEREREDKSEPDFERRN